MNKSNTSGLNRLATEVTAKLRGTEAAMDKKLKSFAYEGDFISSAQPRYGEKIELRHDFKHGVDLHGENLWGDNGLPGCNV